MAHIAHLTSLAGELVTAVTAIPEDQRETFDGYRDFVLHSIRHHNFTRTNHFEVENTLNGLEERFQIIGRDSLAEALRKRLDALGPHRNQYTPEVLHFLLELADQPAQKTNLADLHLLHQPEEDAPPPLTWRDIAREDGWRRDKDIWRYAHYSPGSSQEDEVEVRSVASLRSLTTASSAEDTYQRTAQDLAVEPQGTELLEHIKDSQSWRDASPTDVEGKPRKVAISTTQLLREVLFMLAGLDTSLFDSEFNPSTRYRLHGVSWDTTTALMTSFAECGRKLAPLRAFCKPREPSPLLQVFQNSVKKALGSFDRELASAQTRLVALREDAVISLAGTLEGLRPALSPLYTLSDIVRQLQVERNPHAFRYLELLYDAVGLAQLQGQLGTYRLLGAIFFDCFQVYLRPIRLWMEEGKLVPGDRTFFVSESPTKPSLPQSWRSQFNLLRTPDGSLHAPRFLNPAIHRIFTTGKSIVILKLLKQHESIEKHRVGTEPRMDFATVCPDELELAPFSELFNAAFNAWIQSKHHTAAATLRELLFASYGLSQGLDALQRIYLMSDGARSDEFASSIFRHLDSLSSSWKDRFTLTEIAQEAFSGGVESYRLSAEIDSRSLAPNAVAARSSVRLSLPAIRLNYHLPWPVQIVVSEEAVRAYQALFTFQLQARRALSVLQQPIRSFHTTVNHANSHTTRRYHLLRTKLLWFTTTLLTYLTTLVLTPNIAKLTADMSSSPDGQTTDKDMDVDMDIDDMIAAHASFLARVTAESCLGSRLAPIREAVLDLFDFAIKLEDARRAETARVAREEREVERLAEVVDAASPYRSSPARQAKGGGGGRLGGMGTPTRRKWRGADGSWKAAVEEGDSDDEIGGEDDEEMAGRMLRGEGREGGMVQAGGKPHAVVLREMHGEFERLLRFVAGGLRGAARASRDEAAGKWDLLAEMLEVGIRD